MKKPRPRETRIIATSKPRIRKPEIAIECNHLRPLLIPRNHPNLSYCNLCYYQALIELILFIHFIDVYPFMVGIFDLLSNVTICGGSILTIKYVLTSLHCVDDAREWKDLQVRIFQVDFHHKDRVPG